jgi:hypothetical protein
LQQADEELREGKLRFRGGRGEAATYDEGDEVRSSDQHMHIVCHALSVLHMALAGSITRGHMLQLYHCWHISMGLS